MTTTTTAPVPSITSLAEFRRRVTIPTWCSAGGAIMLVLATFWGLRNVLVTVFSLGDNPGVDIVELFFTTTDAHGRTDRGLMIITWGPFIAAPLGFILLALGTLVARRPARGLYSTYREKGWIAEGFSVDTSSESGCSPWARADLVVLTGPQATAQDVIATSSPNYPPRPSWL